MFIASFLQPMDKMDDIVDIAITEESVIVYNSKYWRAFDMNGQVHLICVICKSLAFSP